MDRPRSRLSSSIDSLSDHLRQYWLSPLLEFTPSEIVPEDVLHAMASGPSPQQTYDQWVEYQEKKSKEVQQWYFGEAAAHHRRMAEYFESVSRDTRRGKNISAGDAHAKKVVDWRSDDDYAVSKRSRGANYNHTQSPAK